MEAIGGDKMTLIMTERWLAALFVQVSEQDGIGKVVSKMLSFDGSEMYADPVQPDLVGKKFSEIAVHYPQSVLLGSMTPAGDLEFGHYEDYTLKEGHELLMLSDGSRDDRTWQEGSFSGTRDIKRIAGIRTPNLHAKDPSMETILVVGWGTTIGPLLIELDQRVLQGTRTVVVSPKPEAKRQEALSRTQRRWNRKIENMAIEHVVGQLGSPTVWDRLPADLTMDKFTRIFILGDDSASDTRHADACTIAAILHIRHLLSLTSTGAEPPIIPEIQDPRSQDLCSICRVSNFISSSVMPVQAMSQVAYQPKLRNVFRSFISVDGQIGIHIAVIEDYLPEGAAIPCALSFMDIQSIVCQTGHVLIGWGRVRKEVHSARSFEEYLFKNLNAASLEWELNPHDKMTKVPWGIDDRVVIMCEHNRESRPPSVNPSREGTSRTRTASK